MLSRCTLAIALMLPAGSLLNVSCVLKDRMYGFFQKEDTGVAVVQVGAKTYTHADIERFFDTTLNEFRDLSNSDKIKSSLLDAFVEDKLLLHQADRLKVEPDPKAVKATMDKIARTQAESRADGANSTRDTELERSVSESLKMQRYVHDYLLKDLSVSDMECEAYYKSHLSGFVTNDIVHVREILVDDPALAQKILAQLKAKRNKNFGDLARVYSKGSSAVEGGDLGHFRRGELPMEFEKAVFALSPGSVSKIVSTKYGYHIFLLDEKIAAHQQKFVEVKDAIREELMLKRERESIQRELESLRRQIPVVIHREKLGFNYIAARSAAGEGRVQ